MISILHYISAVRRLKESEKTVYMLGGESECQEMILAQRDMIKLEVDYYRDESFKFIKYFIFFVIILIIFYIYKGN
jgi:hypothetical protein